MAAWKARVSGSGAPPGEDRGRHRRAEPPFGGHHETQVHVGGGNIGIERVGDQRDAGREEPAILLRTRDLLGNSGLNAPNTVETWTPTFSNTGRPSSPSPPPPGSAPANWRCHGVNSNRPAGGASGVAASASSSASKRREARRARPRRRRGSAFRGGSSRRPSKLLTWNRPSAVAAAVRLLMAGQDLRPMPNTPPESARIEGQPSTAEAAEPTRRIFSISRPGRSARWAPPWRCGRSSTR